MLTLSDYIILKHLIIGYSDTYLNCIISLSELQSYHITPEHWKGKET